MTDNKLVERLRTAHSHGWASVCGAAADRIEALESALKTAMSLAESSAKEAGELAARVSVLELHEDDLRAEAKETADRIEALSRAAEEGEAWRVTALAREAELNAFREDVEGADRRTLSFAMACVRGVDGITVAGALEMQREEIAKLRAQLKALREQEPVADTITRDYRNDDVSIDDLIGGNS